MQSGVDSRCNFKLDLRCNSGFNLTFLPFFKNETQKTCGLGGLILINAYWSAIGSCGERTRRKATPAMVRCQRHIAAINSFSTGCNVAMQLRNKSGVSLTLIKSDTAIRIASQMQPRSNFRQFSSRLHLTKMQFKLHLG